MKVRCTEDEWYPVFILEAEPVEHTCGETIELGEDFIAAHQEIIERFNYLQGQLSALFEEARINRIARRNTCDPSKATT